MNETNNNLTARLYCSFFGHNYFQTKQVTYHIREYTCKSCKKQVTTDVNGNLIELTPKYKEINSVLQRIYSKRQMRCQNKGNITSAI